MTDDDDDDDDDDDIVHVAEFIIFQSFSIWDPAHEETRIHHGDDSDL